MLFLLSGLYFLEMFLHRFFAALCLILEFTFIMLKRPLNVMFASAIFSKKKPNIWNGCLQDIICGHLNSCPCLCRQYRMDLTAVSIDEGSGELGGIPFWWLIDRRYRESWGNVCGLESNVEFVPKARHYSVLQDRDLRKWQNLRRSLSFSLLRTTLAQQTSVQ